MKKMNKHILIQFALAFLVALVFTGCSEDFLEEPKPTDQVSEDVIFGSKSGADAHISGILRRMRGQFTSGHDAGGLNSMYFARVAKGNDIIIGTSWFSFDYENDNREPTYRRTSFSWEFPYYVIGQLNQFILGVEASEALTESEKESFLGQARALRGFYYHQLVLEFCPNYNVDPSYPAPPIYTEPSQEGLPMSTTSEVYDLILDDLEYAVSVLGDERLDKSYVNKQVASGMLARVYQVLGRWSDAETAANIAYGGDVEGALDAGAYSDGFSDMSASEWIWALAQYDDQSQYYFSAPHVQTDHRVLSYSNAYINTDFEKLFSDTDVRRIFAHYYDVDTTSFGYWITDKFSFTFASDIPIIRTPEMILIEAEAKFQNSDEAGAHDLLYKLQVNRDPNAVKSSNTGDALLEEILVERRKELYAEIGVEWFDAKRYQRGITRTANSRVKGAANLEPNDKRFFLKIPQSEIDANENINASVNSNR